MIQHITCEQARAVIKVMHGDAPVNAGDFDWYALYAMQTYPRGMAYGHFASDEFGLYGIIARQPFGRKHEEVVMKQHKTPPTFILPKHYCLNCKRPFTPTKEGYRCCSAKCQQEHKATIEAIEKADKVGEYPF